MITGSSLAHRQAWWFFGLRHPPDGPAIFRAAAHAGRPAAHGLRAGSIKPKTVKLKRLNEVQR